MAPEHSEIQTLLTFDSGSRTAATAFYDANGTVAAFRSDIMDNANLAPTGDLSIDPTRDTSQLLGGVSLQKGDSHHEANLADAQMVMRLGASVVKRWSTLPRDVQEALFETSSAEMSDENREALARFLHDNANGTASNSAV